MSDKQTVVALHTEPLLQTINTPRPPSVEPRLRRRAPWSKLALHPVSLSHILHAASLCFDEADRRPPNASPVAHDDTSDKLSGPSLQQADLLKLPPCQIWMIEV